MPIPIVCTVVQVAVAVKTLYGKQEVQGQFIKEANSMCSLNHKNIIQLYGIVLSHPLMLVGERGEGMEAGGERERGEGGGRERGEGERRGEGEKGEGVYEGRSFTKGRINVLLCGVFTCVSILIPS